MSDPTEPVATNNGPPDEDLSVSVEDIVNSFLELNPEPTEEQVHSLAVTLGMTPEDFEAILYEMFGDLVNENIDPEELTGEEDEDDEDDDDGDYDPTEVFLILYFMRNPKPSDAQIHALAELINMSVEQIEETIFKLLSEFESEDSDTEAEEGKDESVVEPQVADNTSVDTNGLPEVAPQDPGTLKISDETPTLAGTTPPSDNKLPGETAGVSSVPGGGSGDAPAPASVSSGQTSPKSAAQ